MTGSQQVQSHVSASALQAIFTDYDNRDSPYDGIALKISLAGDVAFVYLGRLVEKQDGHEFRTADAQSVGVDAEQLYEALGILLRRGDRQALDRLREGTLPADHPSLVGAVAGTAGIRRRA